MNYRRPDGGTAARAILASHPGDSKAHALVIALNRYYVAVHATNIENEAALQAAQEFITARTVAISPQLQAQLQTILDDLEQCPLCKAGCKKDAAPIVWADGPSIVQ